MGRETRYDLIGGPRNHRLRFPYILSGRTKKGQGIHYPAQFATQQKCLLLRCDNDRRYEGNTLRHIKKLLKRKWTTLHYARALDMFSNYVIAYDMRDTVEEETKKIGNRF